MGTSDVKRNSLGGEWGEGPEVTGLAPCGLAQGPQPNALPEVDGLLLSGGGAVPTACGLLGAGGLHTLGLPFLGATGRDRGLRASWRGDGGCLEGCDDESHGAAPPALPQQVWRASEELLTGSQMTLVMCRPHCEEQGAQASPLNPP